MKFWTETGSLYEVRPDTDEPQFNRVRRVSHEGMRRDEEWLLMLNNPHIEMGRSVVMFLEPLGAGHITTRTTSAVVRIENEGETCS